MSKRKTRLFRSLTVAWVPIVAMGVGFRVLADCSSFGLPFTDQGSVPGFCAAIAEAYYTGITNGTSATTFSPSQTVTRSQMAAFSTRTLDQSLRRGSRRAALGQWWTTTPHYDAGLGLTSVGTLPLLLASDGADIWVANFVSGTVSRVHGSDGKKLDDWTGAINASGVISAMGRIFVTGAVVPGALYMLDPTQPAGPVTELAADLGVDPLGIAFDGNRIWTANTGGGISNGSISIVTPGPTLPWAVTTISAGLSRPAGIVFDGTNMWVTDADAGTILRLDPGGGVIQTVAVGVDPWLPVFDGHNLWVPSSANSSLTVVRASDGAVLKTFSADNGNQNGLNAPYQAAFDGQRVLVTNNNGGLSLFHASDLAVVASVPTPGVAYPEGVCSDGVNFWIAFGGSETNAIGRF